MAQAAFGSTGLELNCLIELTALRTARAIHIGVIGIDESALLTAKNVVFRFFRPELSPTHFCLNREQREATKKQHRITEQNFIGTHVDYSNSETTLVGAGVVSH